ncbi:hypothetical protein SEPCBS57363_003123 [Sporothrix epigloea]|uniref:Uncharacterized protein n=1 Tax=Sporothrix epigloea TaxID=1892477 RepID=A0ABP0DJS3_9PEZI
MTYIPILYGKESFFGWWRCIRNEIAKRPAVAFLDPENRAYNGWTIQHARKHYCGTEPPDLPENDQDSWQQKEYRQTMLFMARHELRAQQHYFDKQLLAIENIIDNTVARCCQRHYTIGMNVQSKIYALFFRVCPDENELMLILGAQYKEVMDACPTKVKPTGDPAFDAWIKKWETMISDQFEQDSQHILRRQWLIDFSLKFEASLPRLSAKVLDLVPQVTSNKRENILLLDQVIYWARWSRSVSMDKDKNGGSKKRPRGHAHTNPIKAESDDEGVSMNTSVPLIPMQSTSRSRDKRPRQNNQPGASSRP